MGAARTVLVGFLLGFAQEVWAGDPAFSSTTLDAKGFQANQPYFGGGGQGSVNGYTGNLILTETDLSIPGRGLDVSVTRIYNSNLWKDAKVDYPATYPSFNKLLKPSWVGYGWDLHFGRIKIPRVDCDETYADISQLEVEWGDGSKEPIIEDAANLDRDGDGQNDDPPEYQARWILPDQSRVAIYNAPDYNPAAPNIEFQANYQYVWFVITKPDGTKYIFTHHVDLGISASRDPSTPCVADNPWSDAYRNADHGLEQYRYVGVYLTRIEDVNGNYISFDYWNSENLDTYLNFPGDPYESKERREGCLWHYPLTKGSPFPKTIEDTMGRTVEFHLDRSSSPASKDGAASPYMDARLDYIKHVNGNGKPAFVDYVYAGDTAFYLYGATLQSYAVPSVSMGCAASLISAGVCDDGKFLVSVQHKVDDQAMAQDGLNGAPIFPPVKYEYATAARTFQLTKVQRARDADLRESTAYGSETRYQYGTIDLNWDTPYCDDGQGTNLCELSRRVVRAMTVCEDPDPAQGTCFDAASKQPALTTFYFYAPYIPFSQVLPSGEVPPGYNSGQSGLYMPVMYGLQEGPFRRYSPAASTDGDIVNFYASAEANKVVPFQGSLSQYIALPPVARHQSYKDGILLSSRSYTEPIGDQFPVPRSAGGFFPPVFNPPLPPSGTGFGLAQTTTYFYSFKTLGRTLNPRDAGGEYFAIDSEPYHKQFQQAVLTQTYETPGAVGGTALTTLTHTAAFDKFGNPLRTVNYGKVQDSAASSALFTLSASCTGTYAPCSGCQAIPRFMIPSCVLKGTFDTNLAATLDVVGTLAPGGVDLDKVITVTEYLHAADSRYEGELDNGGPVAPSIDLRYPSGCLTDNVMPSGVCQDLPIPHLGKTFQRVALPSQIVAYAQTEAPANKLSEMQYKYDSIPLIGDASTLLKVYDDFHHRGAGFTGYPTFADVAPSFSGSAPDPTPQLKLYRGLLTETTTWVKDPTKPVGQQESYLTSETYYDLAGRPVFTRNPERDEALTVYNPVSDSLGGNFLYCLGNPTYCAILGSSGNNPHNNYHCLAVIDEVHLPPTPVNCQLNCGSDSVCNRDCEDAPVCDRDPDCICDATRPCPANQHCDGGVCRPNPLGYCTADCTDDDGVCGGPSCRDPPAAGCDVDTDCVCLKTCDSGDYICDSSCTSSRGCAFDSDCDRCDAGRTDQCQALHNDPAWFCDSISGQNVCVESRRCYYNTCGPGDLCNPQCETAGIGVDCPVDPDCQPQMCASDCDLDGTCNAACESTPLCRKDPDCQSRIVKCELKGCGSNGWCNPNCAAADPLFACGADPDCTCSASVACPAGQHCDNGVCRPNPPGCSADCTDGNGVCGAGCGTGSCDADSDCVCRRICASDSFCDPTCIPENRCPYDPDCGIGVDCGDPAFCNYAAPYHSPWQAAYPPTPQSPYLLTCRNSNPDYCVQLFDGLSGLCGPGDACDPSCAADPFVHHVDWDCSGPLARAPRPPQDRSPVEGETPRYYAYPSKEVKKYAANLLNRLPFYEAVPWRGSGSPTLSGGRVLAEDLKIARKYEDHTGALVAQWLEGPGANPAGGSGNTRWPTDGEGGWLQFAKYLYDDLGRKTHVLRRYETASEWRVEVPTDPSVRIVYEDTRRPRRVTVTTKHCAGDTDCTPVAGWTEPATLNPTVYLFDGLGRNYASYVRDTDNNYIYTLTEYDAKGNPQKTYRPFKLTGGAPSDDPGGIMKAGGSNPETIEYARVVQRDWQDRVIRSDMMQVQMDGVTEGAIPNTETRTHFGVETTLAGDAKNQWSLTKFDAYGRTVYTGSGLPWAGANLPAEADFSGFAGAGGLKRVEFGYDAFGNPAETRVRDYNMPTEEFLTVTVRDSLGSQMRQSSPDAGTATFAYDKAGRLTQSIDARGVSTMLAYDNMGRPVRNQAYGATGYHNTLRYTYDRYLYQVLGTRLGTGIGRVTRFEDATGMTYFIYDEWGRLIFEHRIVPARGALGVAPAQTNCGESGATCETTTSYYHWDGSLRAKSTIDPASPLTRFSMVSYLYDALGRLKAMKVTQPATADLISNILYNTHGAILSFVQGTVPTTYTYEERDADLVKSISIPIPAQPVKQGFDYDANGNIINLYQPWGPSPPPNLFDPANRVGVFTYDTHSRLLTAADNTGANNYLGADYAFTFDDLGNRLTTTTTPATGLPVTLTRSYESAQVQLPSGTPESSGTSRFVQDMDFLYAYDPRGNMIAKNLKFHDGNLDDATLTASPWDGWMPTGGGLVTIDAAGGRSGAPADKGLTLRGAAGRTHVWVGQRFKLEVGVPYTIEGYVKFDSTTRDAYGILGTECFNYDTRILWRPYPDTCPLDDFGVSGADPTGEGRKVGHTSQGAIVNNQPGYWYHFGFTVTAATEAESHIQIGCHLFPAPGATTLGPEDVVHCDDITIAPEGTAYRYDVRNRLAEVDIGDHCVKYYYDGLGQRIRKEDSLDCRPGNSADGTRVDYYFADGQLARKRSSSVSGIIRGPQCGNSVVEDGEVCDGLAIQGMNCTDIDPAKIGRPVCGPDCRGFTATSCWASICGNGILTPDEECEIFGDGSIHYNLLFFTNEPANLFYPNWPVGTGITHDQLENNVNPPYGTCFLYRSTLDVGNLEESPQGQVVGGCTPLPSGPDDPPGCRIDTRNCDCDRNCECRWDSASSPVFSKIDQCDCDYFGIPWEECQYYAPCTLQCPGGSGASGSPIFARAKVTP